MTDHSQRLGQHATAPTAAAGPDPARRSFLKALPLGALAVAAGQAGAAPAPAAVAASAPVASQGYRETEHILTYYRTAAYW